MTPWTIESMEFSRPKCCSEWPFPSPGDHPNPGIKPRSPSLQADSLPAKPPGKPKHTGVGSLSLLQGIFLTQELNPRFLHCRQILYQPIYQGTVTYLTNETYEVSLFRYSQWMLATSSFRNFISLNEERLSIVQAFLTSVFVFV